MEHNFVNRMLRAARVEAALYEEVEADRSATVQAAAVVLLASAAAGVGSIGGGEIGWVAALVLGLISSLVAWVVWAWLTYFIGTRVLATPRTEADVGQLLRTIGFSASPGVIRIVGIIPFLRAPVFFIASVWMMVTMIVAVRQALDYESTLRAVGVVLLGWFVQLLFLVLLFHIAGGSSFHT